MLNFKCFLKGDSGATVVEYSLIGLLVSIVIIAGVTTLGSNASTHFIFFSTKFKTS